MSKDLKKYQLIIGTEQLGGADWGNYDVSEVEKAIAHSIDIGFRTFDTAHVYGLGLAEKRLSEILGPYRYECSIITKVGLTWKGGNHRKRAKIIKNLDYGSMLNATESSLRNLRIDSIPILMAHWPDHHNDISNVVENLWRIKNKGLAKQIGLSNFDINEVCKIHSKMPIDCYQGPLSLLDLSKIEAYKKLTVCGIKVMTYGPIGYGLLSGKYYQHSVFPETDRRHRLKEFSGCLAIDNFRKADCVKSYSKKLGCTMPELSIAMLYRLGVSIDVIVGVKSISQLNENLGALHLKLPQSLVCRLLNALNSINCRESKVMGI